MIEHYVVQYWHDDWESSKWIDKTGNLNSKDRAYEWIARLRPDDELTYRIVKRTEEVVE